MISHLLTTKNTKESKKHCHKSHFTKERPVLSKITKNIVAAFHFWQKKRRKITTHFFSLLSSERLRSLVFSYHLRIFVFSAYFVVDFFYVVYNNKIYHFQMKEPCFQPQLIRLFLLPHPIWLWKNIYLCMDATVTEPLTIFAFFSHWYNLQIVIN